MAFANVGDVWVDIVHSVIPFEVEALYYYNEKLGIYYFGAFDLMETITADSYTFSHISF